MDYAKMTAKSLRQEIRNREISIGYLAELKKPELIEALERTDKGMTASNPLAGWDDYGRCKQKFELPKLPA